jgi:transketolase
LEWLNSKINNGKVPLNTESVWIKKYQNKDIIVIRFGLSSLMYSTFECSGMAISISDLDFFNTLSADHLIYQYGIK